ncbi:MAG: hypothetical protein COU33_03110 [Candidatus Magasanikbacteria bacterium CG10_big_fil_rev_8_21_14_0_10_43_6]|uniref:Blue (type 1) copper domain-containing protein n=1 Tax=Candidatus Magasanikbacteria bacterium CG10_big_fil_rev_8_21_14_0_10_43_6 TaxID=1974650 RepID=A0A2M6W145_9BACT|nr:MAG: hypothetical protein COU33_03110 [Candidatus Magasanikbacteria bacterium CG10_big_fil_rev_8_21_14_0_10_43_6]
MWNNKIGLVAMAGLSLLLVGAGCSASLNTETGSDESTSAVTTEESGDAMVKTEEGDDAMMEKDGDALLDLEADVMVEVEGDAMASDDSADAMSAVVLNLTGKNFAFSQKEIRVKKGDTVTINFTSESGLHDWVVDEFSAQTTKVKDGESASVTFVADKAGSFEYYCSVGSHRELGMVGKLIVE